MVELLEKNTKKRSRLQVIHDIIRVIGSKNMGIKPTHILYKSNLSHTMMEDYLHELLAKGLILQRMQGKNKLYHLTDKGRAYLSEYRVMTNFLDSFGLD
jgi:predicted transcriptional regulator